MYTMKSVSVSELRPSLAAALDRVAHGERLTVTRDGAPVAVLMALDEAAWCTALATLFRDRRPPFTQEGLDGWLAGVLRRTDLSDLLEPANVVVS